MSQLIPISKLIRKNHKTWGATKLMTSICPQNKILDLLVVIPTYTWTCPRLIVYLQERENYLALLKQGKFRVSNESAANKPSSGTKQNQERIFILI